MKAGQGQTIYDIAIQMYGCYEGVFVLMEDNPWMGLDTLLEAGDEIIVRDTPPDLGGNNISNALYFKTNEMSFNSQFPSEVLVGEYESTDFDNGFLI